VGNSPTYAFQEKALKKVGILMMKPEKKK